MKRLLKGILIYLRYALQSIGTVFSGLAVLVYVNLIALKNKNSVIYLAPLHMGDLATPLSFIPHPPSALSKNSPIVILTDSRKKELASLFSAKDVKFVFYGKLIKLCMRSQMCRPVFPAYKYANVVANSKVINLWDLQFIWGKGARVLLNINLYTCAKRELEALANPPSIQQSSLLRPAERAPRESAAIAWRFDAASLPEALKGINPQKAIILNPYAQSMKCDISVFELIAERAAQMGYSPVCSIYGKQKGLKACGSVECTLKEIGAFLSKGAALIALRSGFVDVMLHTGCKIVSILSREIPTWHFDSEETMRINPNVADVVIREGDYCATVDEVFLRLAELEQKERARCSST